MLDKPNWIPILLNMLWFSKGNSCDTRFYYITDEISSFDILFQAIDDSISASDVDKLLKYLAPSGVLLLLYSKLPFFKFAIDKMSSDLVLK